MTAEADTARIESAVQRTQSGDSAAFALVVERFQRPLRLWLAPRCPPGIEADEIAHQAFIHAFQVIGDYHAGTNFHAWLWTIARNQLRAAMTRLRRQGGRALSLTLPLPSAEDAEDVDEPRLVALRACLAALTPAARDLLERRYAQEQPLEDAASALGRSVGALKKALFIIRSRLHDCVRQRLSGCSP